MAKEWILNGAVNRFQLNFKKNVGAVAEAIRKCGPKDMKEWESYYCSNVRSEDHITELGRKQYVKISEVLVSKIYKKRGLQKETHKNLLKAMGAKYFMYFP